MKDIIILVADKNMDYLIRGLMPRIPAIEKLRKFSFESVEHPYRYPGIFNDADDFLRPLSNDYFFTV